MDGGIHGIDKHGAATELALTGVRVLEVSTDLGAYCGRLLADAGAATVKLELPGGDPMRRRPPLADRGAEPGTSLAFAYYHANKTSFSVDYRRDEAVETLAALAADCDVVIASPTPTHRVAGFDRRSQSLSWVPSEAITCFITPFGLTGPLSGWRATHLTSYAMSGLMYEQGPVEGPPVAIPGQPYYDLLGTHAASAIMLALREHERVGGQSIDMSAHEVMTHSYYGLHTYTSAELILGRKAPAEGSSVGTWKCRDGLVQLVVSTDKHWIGLMELLGRPEELKDPTWANPQVRALYEDTVIGAMIPLIAAMSREEFVSRGQELGVPCAFVNDIGEFVHDVQPRSRDFFLHLDVSGVGDVEAPGRPFASTIPLLAPYRRPAPEPGPADAGLGGSLWSQPRGQRRSSAPLARVRVLCLGTAIAGAFTGSILGDLGADVVKLEAPKTPDNMRRLAQPPSKVVREPSGGLTSPMFANFNHSTRSLALDIKEPGAVDIFLQLAASCDVIIENFSPTVMPRWGLTYQRIAEANPRIIMLSLTGFGHTGPRAHYLAYGPTVASFVGLNQAWGSADSTHFDYVAEAHGVFAVLSALTTRDRTGLGTHIDLSEVESGAAVMGPMMLDFIVNDHQSRPLRNRVPGSVYSGVVPCRGDDAWLAVEVEDPDDAARLQAFLARECGKALADSIDTLDLGLAVWASVNTPHQAMRALQRAGVAAAAVQTNEDVARDSQHRARAFLVELDHPELGSIEFAGPPHRLSKSTPAIRRRTPRLGEHNVEVLQEWAGFSAEGAAAWLWPRPVTGD